MTTKASVVADMITEAETRIANLQIRIDSEQRYLDDLRYRYGREIRREKAEPTSTPASNGQSGGLRLPELMLRFLREEDSPLSNAELCGRLKGYGYESTSDKGLPAMVSAAVQRRSDLFRTTGRGIYGLREWDKRGKGSEEVPS